MESDEVAEVDCARHGKKHAAVVCGHLLGTSAEARGFVENSDEPGDYQGWCAACEELFLVEQDLTETFAAFTKMSIVCETCYFDIRARHAQTQ
jgi:hypothetical protein